MRQRHPREKAAAHLAWLRTLPSLVSGQGPIEAAHIRYGDRRYFKPITGMGEKPSDKFAVPLCAEAHRRQHTMAERDFWDREHIDPVLIAILLWCHTGNDDAGFHIISTARNWVR